MKKRSRCYFILGPYRTGTSLVSRVIQQLGADPGPASELFEPTDWNPSGYIQRPDITLLNTRLITKSGGTLTNPGSPLLIAEKTQKKQFDKLDLSWTKNLDSFLIKDPRFCFTLYSWFQNAILSEHELFIVRVSRNINMAAISALSHYDVKHYCKNSTDTALSVIELYDRNAAWHCEKLQVPNFHVTYEDLVLNPRVTITNLAEFLQVNDKVKIDSAVSVSLIGKSRISATQE